MVGFFQGSFDLLHYGHIRAIENARKYCKCLIIGLNTDRFYREYKNKKPIISYALRKKMLEAVKGVDKVVPVNSLSPIKCLKRYGPAIYFLCKEWVEGKDEEIAYMKSIGGKVVILPYYKGISTSQIRHKAVENLVNHNRILCAECHRKI